MKILSTLLATVMAALLAASPVGAAVVVTTDDDIDEGNAPGPGDDYNEYLGDTQSGRPPLETVERLIADLNGSLQESGDLRVDGGRGTAETAMTLVQLMSGDDLDVRVFDGNLFSTLDAEYWGLAKNFSSAQLAGASGYVKGMVRTPTDGPVTVPDPPLHSSSAGRRARHGVPETTVMIPEKETSGGAVEWDNVADAGRFVLSLLGDGVVPVGADRALPGSDQDLVINAGDLVDGLMRPAELNSEMTRQFAGATGQSQLETAQVLNGLSSVSNVGLGKITAVPGGAQNEARAVAEAKDFTLESATLVDLDALIAMLGLGDLDGLPPAFKALLADGLGLKLDTFRRDVVANASLASLNDRVARARQGAGQALSAALGCTSVDPLVEDAYGVEPFALARDLGLPVPTCAADPLGAVQRLKHELDAYYDEFLEALDAALGAAPLVSLTDLSMTAVASAYFEEGDTESEPKLDPRTTVDGAVGQLKIGDMGVGYGVENAASTLQQKEAATNAKLNQVLAPFPGEFQDMIRVQFLPRIVETAWLDTARDRMVTHAGLSLLKVFIDPPKFDPQDVLSGLQSQYALPTVQLDLADDLVDLSNATQVAHVRPADPAVRPRALTDPITITVGQLDAIASFYRPGVDLPAPECESGTDCPQGVATGISRDSSGGGGSSQNLPRTGGASGNWPIAFAVAVATLAYALSRLARGPQVLASPVRGSQVSFRGVGRKRK